MKDLSLPTDWRGVSVSQFARIEMIRKATAVGYTNAEVYVLMAAELTGIRPEKLMQLPIAEQVSALGFLATPPPVELVRTFRFAGARHDVSTDMATYGLAENLREEPLGKLITLDALKLLTGQAQQAVNDGNFSKLPLLVAVLVTDTDDWEGKDAYAQVTALAELFQGLPITTALGVYAFFLTSLQRSQNGIPRFTKLLSQIRRVLRLRWRFMRSMAGVIRFTRTRNASA